MNDNLEKRQKQLQLAYKQNQMTQAKYQQQMAAAKQAHDQQLSTLESQQAQAEKQLKEINQQLAQTSGQLAKTENLLGQKEGENQALNQKIVGEREGFQKTLGKEREGFQAKLGAAEQANADKMAQLKGAYEAQRGKDRAAFDAQMNKEKLGAADRAAKEAAFRAGAAKKEREYNDKIAGLNNALTGTSQELAKAKAEIDARKKVAKDIKDAFAKAGVKADVDGQTGDVTLDFGDHYFETGRAEIKPEMAAILQKAIPIYSKSLMENGTLSKKIDSVEIVGFASPTYKGRVIDPKSMDPEDRKAAEYNMDLSYQRARSIFQYVFDQDRMRFKHQQDVRNMVKVSGKSFFEANKVDRDVANESVASFCKKYDCKKSQRVLIKFNVNQK